MPKLQVDTDKYLTELIEEHTTLDMNADPEIDCIADASHRVIKSDRWLESRTKQLTTIEEMVLLELKTACRDGYLESGSLIEARKQYHEAFETLRANAKENYDRAT
ncbi:MAG: hypothetical protein Q7S74_02640 [Nanoarchaeota archaeon]|nr:hypothetical protein [Nanoarchaeota archaeon]